MFQSKCPSLPLETLRHIRANDMSVPHSAGTFHLLQFIQWWMSCPAAAEDGLKSFCIQNSYSTVLVNLLHEEHT